MKTYTQFFEDIEQRRKQFHQKRIEQIAAHKEKVAAFREAQKEKERRRKEKAQIKAELKKELQTEQHPVMEPEKYGAHNLAVSRRQQTQKSGLIRRAQQNYYSNQRKYQTAKNRNIANILKSEEDS
jgi:hypothetical protein